MQLAMYTHHRSRVDELQEDNHILRDACLRLESEVAKLRNVVAVTAVTAVTAVGSQQGGSNNGSLTVPPRVSHMVIPEHGHVAWEVSTLVTVRFESSAVIMLCANCVMMSAFSDSYSAYTYMHLDKLSDSIVPVVCVH
jgi:hypothetical protein